MLRSRPGLESCDFAKKRSKLRLYVYVRRTWRRRKHGGNRFPTRFPYAAAACAAATLRRRGLSSQDPRSFPKDGALSCAGPFGCIRNRFRMFRPLLNHPFPDDPLAAEAVSLRSAACATNRDRLVR
jgi:hypothetical protein